jgi:hypothetical protein
VLGIENLSRNSYNAYGGARPRSKARLAALCALFPGMGAVLNRQNVKAIVHFVTVAGLFQLSNLNVMEGLFALAGFAFYVYSIIDAYRTAQMIAQGESPSVDEERFKRQMVKRAPAIGLFLIVVGLLMLIQIVQPLGLFISIARLMPVALIILGGYLLTRYFKRSRGEGYEPSYSERPAYPLITGAFGEGDRFCEGRGSRSHNKR